MNKIYIVILAILIISILIVLSKDYIVPKYESLQYTVLEKNGSIEQRKYKPYIAAEIKINGNRDESINIAFPILFDYINGKNKTGKKIAMTTPVLQQEENTDSNSWKTTFVTPSKYNLDNLPKPKDERIKIYKKPETKRIVITFNGRSSSSNLNKNKQKIDDYIKENNIEVKGDCIYAFYDPPLILPVLRRNEIMYIMD